MAFPPHNTIMDKKLRALHYFINHGWPIFPIHHINPDGSCTCGKSSCKSIGKHPRTPAGFYDASTDTEQIDSWHSQWPQANWAMRCGDRLKGGAGKVVIDIDNKSDGIATWENLREENPGPIETVTVGTGKGGQHLWFNYPDGLDIPSGQAVLGKGIDIRANGGYVLIPPSKTTGMYKFEINPDETPIADLPDWILTRLDGTGKKSTHKKIPDVVNQGERHQTLITTAGALRRVGLGSDVIEAALGSLRDTKMEGGDHPISDEEITDVVKWIATKDSEYSFTDLGNAERFLKDHRENVRYCYAWCRWMIWNGKKWAVDDMAELSRRAHETVRGIYAEASDALEDDKRRAIVAHALRSEARWRIENMLVCAQPYLAIKPEELDKNIMLLNVRNGVIDLETGDLHPHNRDYLITKYIDVDYDPRANCPEWEKFITMITGGDNELAYFLQKAVGYTLTGNTDEACLFFLYGSGQNGKTTFLEVVKKIMSDYMTKIDSSTFMTGWNNNVQGPTPYIVKMAGARFVVGSEIAQDHKLNESLIKDLTGSDTMTGRALHKDPFDFNPQHKIWLYGNHKPKIIGTDLAIWRRIRVVPFMVTIGNDIKKPMGEVMEMFNAEISGILTWAVLGTLFWINERLGTAPLVQRATIEYRTEQDLVQQFLDDKCQAHPDSQVGKDKLFVAWRDWCEKEGEDSARKRSKKWLTRQIIEKGFSHNSHGDCIVGLEFA